jgi:hypothetical protein
MSSRLGKGIVLAFVLAVAVPLIVPTFDGGSFQVAAQSAAKLEATVFSYDGKDFTRTETTVLTAEGKSAVGTKLDPATPAYKALARGHSFSGEVTVFGKKYDGSYAPVTGAGGKVTGALFVGVAK